LRLPFRGSNTGSIGPVVAFGPPRGVGRLAVESDSAGTDPDFLETLRLPFRGSNTGSIGPVVAFGPPRATFAVSGRVLRVFSLRCRRTDLTPAALLSAACLVSSKSSLPANRTRMRNASAPLLGFSAPSAHDRPGRPYVPAETTFRQHLPSSGFLTLSTVCSARIHARLPESIPLAGGTPSLQRSWGFPALSARSDLSIRSGQVSIRVPSPRPSPPPRRARFGVPSLPVLRREASCRPLPGMTRLLDRRALRGLDRRRVGVSGSGEPPAPTVLRFLADLHTRE